MAFSRGGNRICDTLQYRYYFKVVKPCHNNLLVSKYPVMYRFQYMRKSLARVHNFNLLSFGDKFADFLFYQLDYKTLLSRHCLVLPQERLVQ